MKILYAFCTIAFFHLFACSGSTINEPTPSATITAIPFDDAPFVLDTTRINYIDSICLATNKAMFHKPLHHHIDVSQFNQPSLKIGYYTNPQDSITRILITENENRVMNLKYIFYKNGLPIQMHSRYWDKNTKYVEETYFYFGKNGKMFYAGERGTELFDDEIPAKLKSIDLTIPEKSKKELYDFVIKYWELSKPLVDNDMAAEAASKTGQ